MSLILGIAQAIVWIGQGILSLLVFAVCWAYLVLTYFRRYGVYRVRLGPVAGYTVGRSFGPDETIGLHVHTTNDAEARVYRLAEMRDDTGISIPVQAAVQSNRYDRKTGLTWPANAEIASGQLEPGLHVVEIRQRADPSASFRIPLVIRPRQPRDVAVILPTNTWEAYNKFAGISAYENDRFDFVTRKFLGELDMLGYKVPPATLPWARPNSHISEDLDGQTDPFAPFCSMFARNDWAMLAFLEREGYDYGVYSDIDLAFSSEVSRARLMIFTGHSEYWPDEMFGAFEQYLQSGGHALVTVSAILLGWANYYDQGITIRWNVLSVPRDYASSMAGATVTELGQLSGAAPFRVERSDHWVFDNTGVAEGDLFGAEGAALGMEQEGVGGVMWPELAARRAKRIGANPRGTPGGASGLYQSKIGRGSGAFKVLATGTNAVGPAQMVYRDTEAGGWVFNTSSPTFAGTLDRDKVTSQMFRNLIDNALGKTAPADKRALG